MNNHVEFHYHIDSKEESLNLEFFNEIKVEYYRFLIKVYLIVIIIIFLYITSLVLTYFFNQVTIIHFFAQFFTLILFSVYILIHFFLLSYKKLCPKLINFLNNELGFLGFTTQRKFKIDLGSFIFYVFTVFIFILTSISLYFAPSYPIIIIFSRLIIIYMIIGVSIPILRGTLHDKLIVKLRSHYLIQLEIEVRLIKREEIQTQMIRIYMRSNKLGLKSIQKKFDLYKEISEKKWLPRKGRLKIFDFFYSKYFYFREYSTPINFKEHFLNLVSAIKDWDDSSCKMENNND